MPIDTPRTIRDEAKRSGRPGSLVGLGGGVGLVALVFYAIVTHQGASRTVTESVILVILLYLFVVAMLVGIFRWASLNPKFPYKIVWPVLATVWGACFAALFVFNYILYRYIGYFGFRSKWESALLMGAIGGTCVAAASKFGALKPKIVGGGQRPVVELNVSPNEKQAAFSVTLTQFPANKKIALIGAIREIRGLSLKDAKNLVEGVPSLVKEGISQADADAVKKKLDETGATVEVK